MNNSDFNPEKKYQEWLNRPAKQRVIRKKRFSLLLLLLNISVIIVAYLIITKNQNHVQYYSVKTENDGYEYRLSVIDNVETSCYNFTLTITGIDNNTKPVPGEKNIGTLFVNYKGGLITTATFTGNKDKNDSQHRNLILNSQISKRVIDIYLNKNGLKKKPGKSFLNLKKDIYLIECQLYMKNNNEPLKLTIKHEVSE